MEPTIQEVVGEIRLELLGGLRAIVGSTTITRFRTHRSAVLVAYIALHPSRLHSREELGEMLWPDEDPERQRSRLRYELSVLRAALAQDPFRADGNATLALAAGVVSDVSRFEAELKEAQRSQTPQERVIPLRQAVALYQGDLLPGYYEEWAVSERERLAEMCFDALTRLIQDLETLEQRDEARAVRRRAASRFPEREWPAPPASPATRPLYVPDPLGNRFFGRDAEIERLHQWLDNRARLITITGMGGMGKTRLMMEAARERDSLLISLSEASKAEQLYEALASALKVTLQSANAPRVAVLRALQARPGLLLLLDNLEQILPAVAPLLQEILQTCPNICCIATSRRPLRLSEERILPLDSLSVAPATALLLDRARQTRPDFARNPRGEALAGEIAALVEGLPLAIELAAARAITLGPAQMRDQLKAHAQLNFLKRIRPGIEARHRGLDTVLEWSVNLLTPEHRRTLGMISVFHNGFSLEAAEAICGEKPSALDALDDLQLNSLLGVSFDEEEEARYELRGVVREYAAELLTPKERDTARDKHHQFFLKTAQSIAARLASPDWSAGRLLLQRESENLRFAQRYAIEKKRRDTLPLFFDALASAWLESGRRDDSFQLIEALEPLLEGEPPSPRLARLLGVQAADARRRGEPERAWRYWQRRLEVARSLGADSDIANTLFELVGQAIDQKDFTNARAYLQECEKMYAEKEKGSVALTFLILQARLASGEGDAATALRFADEARMLLSTHAAPSGETIFALFYLPQIYRAMESGERTEASLREGIVAARTHDYVFMLGVLSLELARLRRKQGRYQEAGNAYRVAADIHSELESRLKTESAAEMERFRVETPALSAAEVETVLSAVPWRTRAETLLVENRG